MSSTVAEIDVRTIAPYERHAQLFARFDALQTGGAFVIVSDHNPVPLHMQLEGRAPGQVPGLICTRARICGACRSASRRRPSMASKAPAARAVPAADSACQSNEHGASITAVVGVQVRMRTVAAVLGTAAVLGQAPLWQHACGIAALPQSPWRLGALAGRAH